uniref:Secreted protein n=1 Tax=Schistosoma curassoni TaxID=6186 RepID=A0A183L0H8_9TREM
MKYFMHSLNLENSWLNIIIIYICIIISCLYNRIKHINCCNTVTTTITIRQCYIECIHRIGSSTRTNGSCTSMLLKLILLVN